MARAVVEFPARDALSFTCFANTFAHTPTDRKFVYSKTIREMTGSSPELDQWQRLGAIALVGHRGAGKSTLGQLVAADLDRPFVDLDEEVSRRSGRSIDDLVENSIEHFRELEAQTLTSLCEQSPAPIIACGAGVEPRCESALIVWLDREDWSDEVRRSQRPRVRPELREEQEWEWMERTRRPRWREAAHLRLPIPRGRTVEHCASDLVTLLKWACATAENNISQKTWFVPSSPADLQRAIRDRQRFGLAGIEIRSDVFTERPSELAENPYLASLRHDAPGWFERFKDAQTWDIDLRYVTSFFENAPQLGPSQLILSHHPHRPSPSHLEELRSAATRLYRHFDLQPQQLIIKYVPTVGDFEDLREFLDLVASIRGLDYGSTLIPGGPFASWLRPVLAEKNETNYLPVGLRERRPDHPSALDLQGFLPHLTGEAPEQFDGLIGDPVTASQGDLWHRRHSLENDEEPTGYLKIPVPRDKLGVALQILEELPIRGLSITSPLKREAARSDRITNPDDLPALNTLVRSSGADRPWMGTDTDATGMAVSLEHLEARGLEIRRVIVFGRGGASHAVLRGLRSYGCTVVAHISARAGWSEEHSQLSDIDLIVNAAGFYGRHSEYTPPCRAWLDLNYVDVAPPPPNTIHLQGDIFFDAQALAQRSFWIRRATGSSKRHGSHPPS